jgi:4-amino-4-deoxy-L-arabinose transferase-like glycosyltransferase
MKKKPNESIMLIAGLLFSAFAVIAMPRLFFSKDISVFWEWEQFWKNGWSSIYISCKNCNYPFIGMLSSAGLLSWLDNLGSEKALYIYRLILAAVDGLNVLITYWILKKLSVERPAYWAGLTGLSISAWAGGALWVQIDGISQFFLLLTLACLVHTNSGQLKAENKYRLNLIFSSILLGLVVLTKQLTLFSALPLGFLLASTILVHERNWKKTIVNTALTLGVFLFSLLSADLFLKLKQPYTSHLYYVWKEGSSHSNVISGNGFNIWMFLGRDMWSSSHVPIFSNMEHLTPYNVGMFFFLSFAGIITLSLLLFLRKHIDHNSRFVNKEILLNFVLYLALVNLCFNVFLTGTHERYLYHFYPYVLISVVGLSGYNQHFSKKMLTMIVLGASLYGVFILQIMTSIDFRIGYLSHWLMGIFHLILFVWLFIVCLKYQNLRGNFSALFAKPIPNLPTVR